MKKQSKPKVLLRWKEVQERVGLSRTRVHYLMRDGLFPKQIQLGHRTSAWVEEEINEWIEERIAESRSE